MLGFLPEPLRSPFTLFANLFNSRGSRGPVALPTATVALVMMDNREPNLKRWLEQHGETEELSLDAQARLVTMLTAYLNARYACSHGYVLLYYRLSQPGCTHPVWGTRHPSYCKLAAIGDALAAKYEWVVYLDSDAFVRAPGTLASLLHKYGASGSAGTGTSTGASSGTSSNAGTTWGPLVPVPKPALMPIPAPAPALCIAKLRSDTFLCILRRLDVFQKNWIFEIFESLFNIFGY